MIVIGSYLNFEYYQNIIHPLNLTDDNLDDIMASSNPMEIKAKLVEVKDDLISVMERLPESKNPVWLFPTESTNFLRIESDVTIMITSIDKISIVPKDSSAYHTGLLDIHARADSIRENIVDAKGFLHGSASNVFFILIWVYGIIGLAIMWIRK